jgi:hypothetical protein
MSVIRPAFRVPSGSIRISSYPYPDSIHTRVRDSRLTLPGYSYRHRPAALDIRREKPRPVRPHPRDGGRKPASLGVPSAVTIIRHGSRACRRGCAI